MCGIFGTYGIGDEDEVRQGMTRLAHRGPDGSGLLRVGDAVHGHVRLALMDLSSASAQPFRVPGGVLSWVGELWNHGELRDELRASGRRFHTTGDTEVLAASIERWGVAGALTRLEGMFSLAWSSATEDVLARDRWGKVPLYVRRRGGTFSWSSERKGWPGRAGGAAVALPPATSLDLRTGRVASWYDLPDGGVEPVDPIGRLSEAVRIRLAADAPTCVLVSGGLDSALILTLAAEERPDVVAYVAKLDPRAEDLRQARLLCSELGVRLEEVTVDPPTAEDLSKACETIEVASKAQSEIAALCVPLARRIASDGFKACLSGEAADELFGGYGNSIIKASSLDDAGWIAHRRFLLGKMARGNFVRCNKSFMAAGVECRLPFMDRMLVEAVLGMGKRDCPPGKGLLKQAAAGVVPDRIVRRAKETFQGGSGMSEAAARAVADPLHFYHAETRRRFGRCVME